MEFRAEAFNAFNHTQFEGNSNTGGISTNFGSSNFGAGQERLRRPPVPARYEVDLLSLLQDLHLTPRSRSV